jgi:hypothetical protein
LSDLGGSHTWLLDVGGGLAREGVASDRRAVVERPGDEELLAALGATSLDRADVSDTLERVRALLPDGRTIRAVLKLGGFWRSPKERLLYVEALRPEVEGSPTLLAAGERWLLLEELADARAVAVDDESAVRAVYRRLADVHAGSAQRRFSRDLESELSAAPLSAPDADAFVRGVEALAMLAARAARDAEAWEIGDDTVRRVEGLCAWAAERGTALAALGPPTLLHGDYQRRNWLLGPDGAPRVLDWELAARGPGVLDLYYLQPRGPGAGHAPAGPLAEAAVAWYAERLGELASDAPAADDLRRHLPDAIAWGALAAARLRLDDFYAATPRSRSPRGELPGAAAHLIRYAAAQVGVE